MTLGVALMFLPAFIIVALATGPPLFTRPSVLLIIVWLILTLLINIKPLFQYLVKGEVSAQQVLASTHRTNVTHPGQSALPSFQSIPADVYRSPAPATAEMATPPSVTEQTTNLLKNELI